MGSFYFLPGWVGDVLQSFAQSSQNLLKRSELNLCISNRMLYTAMTQVALNSSRIKSIFGQVIAG